MYRSEFSDLLLYTRNVISAAEQNIKNELESLINLVRLNVIHPEDDACKFFETSEKSSLSLDFPSLIPFLNSPCNSCVKKA